MIKKFLRRLLYRPVLWATNKYSSRPNAQRIKESLDKLYANIKEELKKSGLNLSINSNTKYIIFSDQHKGGKNGSDDFMLAEKNYLTALQHYNDHNYILINLGDCEELWENTLETVKKNNQASFEAEKKFIERDAFIKVFGNHDIYWNNDPLASFQIQNIYGQKLKIYEGLILTWNVAGKDFDIFLTHGHQGDGQSDANAFSAWFISKIWAPLQSYLSINFNTPAYDNNLKSLHNAMMYEWSAAQNNLLLITGHTHQPVFCSLTHLERLFISLEQAKAANDSDKILELQQEVKKSWRYEPPTGLKDMKLKPTYFNTGCCCFDDGDITGIEITSENICLVKWEYDNNNVSKRVELETISLPSLFSMVQ
jgi:predicted phosphodiesterase